MLKIRNSFGHIALVALVFIAPSVVASDMEKGEEIYAARCAICHGERGVSVMPDVPNFAQYEGLMKPDALLLESLSDGKNAMPAYLGILSEQDMKDVISFLRTLN
jgi:mono/diheme cytochrome c family protein